MFKWQLLHDEHLVSRSFNLGIKLVDETQKVVMSNIDTDYLTYFKNISVREAFQIGFGDQCYIYDQLIDPINKMLRNEKIPEPKVIQRLRFSLPPLAFAKFFPKSALYPENITFFRLYFA
jgi:hypothetical protein